jgi:hypothetical protein
VVKPAPHRDKLARKRNVIAFEMDGPEAWANFPIVIIKGVCDYADSQRKMMARLRRSGCCCMYKSLPKGMEDRGLTINPLARNCWVTGNARYHDVCSYMRNLWRSRTQTGGIQDRRPV